MPPVVKLTKWSLVVGSGGAMGVSGDAISGPKAGSHILHTSPVVQLATTRWGKVIVATQSGSRYSLVGPPVTRPHGSRDMQLLKLKAYLNRQARAVR